MSYSTSVGSRWRRAAAVSTTSCTTSRATSSVSAIGPTVTTGGDVEAIKAKEMEAWWRTALGGLAAEMEPELDQFMEAYH